MGYSLIYGTNFDYNKHIVHSIGERLNADREKIIFLDFYILFMLIFALLNDNDTKVPLF